PRTHVAFTARGPPRLGRAMFAVLHRHSHHTALYSFPTRRSSDLISRQLWWGHQIPGWYGPDGKVFVAETEEEAVANALGYYAERSEEHTSELQSPDHLVCRLLLEKKNKRALRRVACDPNPPQGHV